MAKKKCPDCEQTLPVACKSCPCGHVFIAKKCSLSKDSNVKKTMPVSVKRLRPERPKREIPDYEYRDDYTRISGGNGGLQLKSSKRMKLLEEVNCADDEDGLLAGKDQFNNEFNRSDSAEIGTVVKRKRGRPKGSKNKPKDDHTFMADLSEDNDDALDGARKLGKSKHSRDKIYKLPPIPQDKVMAYSLILSDINERFMSQNKIKCLPGL